MSTVGILSVVWLVCWVLFVYDTPSEHPRITDAERKFLEANLAARDKTEVSQLFNYNKYIQVHVASVLDTSQIALRIGVHEQKQCYTSFHN